MRKSEILKKLGKSLLPESNIISLVSQENSLCPELGHVIDLCPQWQNHSLVLGKEELVLGKEEFLLVKGGILKPRMHLYLSSKTLI